MSLSTLSYVFQGQEKLVTLPPHSIWRRKSQQNAIICKNTLLRVDYPSISCHRYFLLKLQAVKSSIRKSSSLIQNPCEMMAESCVISSSTHTHSTSGAWQMHCTQHRAVCTPSHAVHIQLGDISMENIIIIIIWMLKLFPSLLVLGFFSKYLKGFSSEEWNSWATNSRPGSPSFPTSRFPPLSASRGSEKLPINWENVHNSSGNCYSWPKEISSRSFSCAE